MSKTFFMTFGGEARSGKGTSVTALRERLTIENIPHRAIDQGLKFRALADLALGDREPLDSPTSMASYMQTERTQLALLKHLKNIAEMAQEEVRATLYKPAISEASAKIGRVPEAHGIVVGLLKKEVQQATNEKSQVVLIDGRAMEKYGRQFANEGMGNFVMGWYFRCDAAVAGRRSVGMFADHANMNSDERSELLTEIIRISDRNRSDAMRATDPMVEPYSAYRLDLRTYGQPGYDVPYKVAHDIVRRGMAVVNTSYTHNVNEMTAPVTDVSMLALMHLGAVSHQAAGIPVGLPN